MTGKAKKKNQSTNLQTKGLDLAYKTQTGLTSKVHCMTL